MAFIKHDSTSVKDLTALPAALCAPDTQSHHAAFGARANHYGGTAKQCAARAQSASHASVHRAIGRSAED